MKVSYCIGLIFLTNGQVNLKNICLRKCGFNTSSFNDDIQFPMLQNTAVGLTVYSIVQAYIA